MQQRLDLLLQLNLLGTEYALYEVQAHITYTGTATPIVRIAATERIRRSDFSALNPSRRLTHHVVSRCRRGLASNAQLYSTYTRETAEEDHAAHANNTFQHCPNSATTAASHSTNPSSSQTAHSSSTGAAGSGHHVDTGAVIGGVVGGVLGLCLLMLGAACVMRRARGGKAAVYDEQPLDATEATSLGAHPFTLQQTDLTSNLRTPPAYEKHAPQRLEGSASEPPTSSGAGEQVGRTHASTVPYTASAHHEAGVAQLSGAHEREEDAGRIDESGLRLPPAYSIQHTLTLKRVFNQLTYDHKGMKVAHNEPG
ncbi:predicted protein [Postia placenta Mad-698-R]|nr:predicted protein [Postia placenta Mad-698-R]